MAMKAIPVCDIYGTHTNVQKVTVQMKVGEEITERTFDGSPRAVKVLQRAITRLTTPLADRKPEADDEGLDNFD